MGLLHSSAGRATAGVSRETLRTPSTLDDDRPKIRLTRIQNPIWKPVDLHLFVESIGDPPSFTTFESNALALLNPLPDTPHINHPAPELGIGPGNPHGPPYDQEFRNGIARLGLDERGPFTVAEFSGANAVWLVWMTVPKPGVPGSSPDFADPPGGPIIPHRLFPFAGTAVTIRNGALFSTPVFTAVPRLDTLSVPPVFPVAGHSHFPEFYADSIFLASRAAPITSMAKTTSSGSGPMRSTQLTRTPCTRPAASTTGSFAAPSPRYSRSS